MIGEQVWQAAGGVGADPVEHVAEVGERIDVEPLAGGGEAGEDGGGAAAAVATVPEPVLPPDGDAAQAALRPVVVDLQVTVLRVAPQRIPVVERISDRLRDGGLGQDLGLLGAKVALPSSSGTLLSRRKARRAAASRLPLRASRSTS